MKKQIAICGVLSLFAVCITGCSSGLGNDAGLTSAMVYSNITKPNDAVTRTIRNGGKEWGSAISLTPKPFDVGAKERDVIEELTRSKYKIDPDRELSWRKPRIFPTDSQFYEKSVEGLPCSVRFGVVVRFDDQHRLIEAWGAEDEAGCL